MAHNTDNINKISSKYLIDKFIDALHIEDEEELKIKRE